MNEVINLLIQKNQHLERFFKHNEAEILNFFEGNFDNLERFYQSREVILDMISCIDRMIDEAQVKMGVVTPLTAEDKKQVISTLDKKNDLVTQILSQDLQILSLIEQAKSGIIKELTQVKAAKKAVGSYKSGTKEPQLDEKV
jgi:hypothetical protein